MIGRRQFPLAGAAVLAIVVVVLAGCQSATQPAPALDPSSPPQALAVDPSDGSLLKAAGGVFRSTDQGRTLVAYFKSLWSPEHRQFQEEQNRRPPIPMPSPNAAGGR